MIHLPSPETRRGWIVAMVVLFVGMDGMMLVACMCWCATHKITIDAVLASSITGLGGTVIGYLGGLLSSTKYSSPTPPESTPPPSNPTQP